MKLTIIYPNPDPDKPPTIVTHKKVNQKFVNGYITAVSSNVLNAVNRTRAFIRVEED